MAAKTLFQKIWEDHLVERTEEACLIYIDRHLIHEVTSPQAFEGLRQAKRPVRRPDCTLAVADHNVPTENRAAGIDDPESRLQVQTLEANCQDFGVTYYPLDDIRQGIVHVVGPEQGFSLPGLTIVCGDSHTSTHGAFGALAFGIGTSEVEHVLATQTLIQRPAKSMRITVTGPLKHGVGPKDIILAIIAKIGTAGGTGYVIEFAGDAITALSMEGRMTICNMAIEAGARAGMIAPDQVTFDYLRGRPLAPKGAVWEQAIAYWNTLKTDKNAVFDKEITLDGTALEPFVTWGTSPEDALPITGYVPILDQARDETHRQSLTRTLEYMGLKGGERLQDIEIDTVFIGSCTNSRIEDLRDVARLISGKTVKSGLRAMIVPGSGLVREMAESEGLDIIFKKAGFDWREPGCSMCLAMNADKLSVGERCASTSNRNFEGRQGRGGRTHLMSPIMAASAAITGRLTDARDIL